MSSLCTSVSPSQLSIGPGGWVVDEACSLNRARVSAGEPSTSRATSLSLMALNRNAEPMSLTKNLGAVMAAVAVM